MRVLFIGIFVILLTGISIPACAQEANGSFQVRPAKIELHGAPGTKVNASILLTNSLGVPATFGISFEDVEGSQNPEESVVLLGIRRGPYSLRGILSAPRIITLLHGEEKRIPISITLPAEASPGGLYGSVVFTPQRGGSEGNIIPDSRIGVLLFVRVDGEVDAKGNLINFFPKNHSSIFFGKPEKPVLLGIEFTNTGTVHLNPYGQITHRQFFGEKEVYPVDPWYVLPKSVRSRDIEVKNLYFGWNRLSLELNRGYDDVIDTKQISLIILPSPIVLGLLVSFLGILILFILWRGRSIHLV